MMRRPAIAAASRNAAASASQPGRKVRRPRHPPRCPLPRAGVQTRTGGGLTISNARKSIKPSSRDCHAIGAAIRVMSWPATSSITTNCGSFRPLARATAWPREFQPESPQEPARTATQGCQPGTIERARSHHSRTVVAEPQVPGSGTQVSDAEKRRDQTWPRAAAWDVRPRRSIVSSYRRSLASSRSSDSGSSLIPRVLHRRRDHIRAAGPFAQIDQAAAVAAEREFGILAGYRLSCRWDTSA